MNIIICNDDGIDSNGLKALAKRLSMKHNVLVVAPSNNCSAKSHALTIGEAVKVDKILEKPYLAYSLSGTPVDCLKFAKLYFSDFNTDIVVSGINKGHNLGSDILYSGTVSIALEGAFYGHPSFAFSAFNLGESDFENLAIYAERLIEKLLPLSSRGEVWNVNFPNCQLNEIKGVKFAKLGKHLYSDRYEKISENQYKLVGEVIDWADNDADCDTEWIKNNFITITPILFDRTNYSKLKNTNCLEINLD